MRSLQVRLMTGTMAGTVILLSIAGVVIYDLVRSTLLADFDLSLLTRAQALASLVEEDGGTIEAEFSERHLPEFSRRDRPDYYELRNTDGRSLFRSPSLADRQLKPVATTGDFPIFQPIVLPDGRAGRLVVLAFHPKSESQRDEEGEHRGPGKNVGQGNRLLTLCMARDTADLEQTLARTRMLLICVCGFATLATCLFLAFVVRTGLRPLRELAHRIEGLDETALATPIEVRGTPAELAPVVERLNDLLSRLDTAFQREQTFSSDMAHELRTPLAGLRSTLEVALRKEREAAAYQTAIRGGLDITCQMQSVVDNLLTLVRVDAGQLKVHLRAVDLGAMIQHAWQPFTSTAALRTIHVRRLGDHECLIKTDPERFSQVLRNVFDNAVSYVNAGGEILIEVFREGRYVRLTIANSGSEVAAEDTTRVFERFWRGDKSRSGTGTHCGLGLCLSKRMIELLGGTIAAETEMGGIFRITIHLPAADGGDTP